MFQLVYGTGSGGVYVGDDYNRFATTALIYDTGELKAWSVDENGVVKWDTRSVTSAGASLPGDDVLGSNIMNWSTAKTACTTNGGRLPSIEQLGTLSHAWYSKANTDGNVDPWAPLGFVARDYWSSTPVPSSPTTLAYGQSMGDGTLYYSSQSSGRYVRCVRQQFARLEFFPHYDIPTLCRDILSETIPTLCRDVSERACRLYVNKHANTINLTVNML